jgi:hypothetical protein
MTEQIEVKQQYQYSVKLETTARGFIQPTIHAYDNVGIDACDDAINALAYTVDALKKRGYKVATEIKENEEIKTRVVGKGK